MKKAISEKELKQIKAATLRDLLDSYRRPTFYKRFFHTLPHSSIESNDSTDNTETQKPTQKTISEFDIFQQLYHVNKQSSYKMTSIVGERIWYSGEIKLSKKPCCFFVSKYYDEQQAIQFKKACQSLLLLPQHDNVVHCLDIKVRINKFSN
jgi:hypothetical protein